MNARPTYLNLFVPSALLEKMLKMTLKIMLKTTRSQG
jgi:hypothetical protein